MIADYLERLTSRLAFDPALARAVREEVEDHLREAAARHGSDEPAAAERHAIANFGDPAAIAAQFAVASLARRARHAGAAAVLMLAAVFVLMQARVAWYAATQWPAIGMPELGAAVFAIDRYAFWAALLLTVAGWVYLQTRGVPAMLDTRYRRELARFALLCSLASAALIASVAGDAILTCLRFAAAAWSTHFLVPLASLAVELACAALLVSRIRAMARTSSVLRDPRRQQIC